MLKGFSFPAIERKLKKNGKVAKFKKNRLELIYEGETIMHEYIETSEAAKVTIKIVNGVEGPSVYINDYRVAGHKPWGGGKVTSVFTATKEDMLRALGITEKDMDDVL